MPKLNDHGLGGGGKALGVPVYPLNNVTALQKDDVNGTWQSFFGETTATAPVQLQNHASSVYGDEMYFIGTKSDAQLCYKYNVKTRVWTQLAKTPIADEKYWAVTLNTDIWYVAGTKIYRYDILTDTHHSIATTPYTMGGTKACTDGQYIYSFGGGSSSTDQYKAYKFDTTNNTFTQLASITTMMTQHGCVYGGDGYVYLFGGSTNPTISYKYNIANNSYTALSTIPFNYSKGMICQIDNYIYLLCSGHTSNDRTTYVFDINSGTYFNLTSPPNGRALGHAGVVDDAIYMIGGTLNSSSYYYTGDSMLALKVITSNVAIQKLLKGTKCYTDGDVKVDAVKEAIGQYVLNGGTTLEKTNGAVTIPTDGEYALVGSNYATIGG